MKEDGACLLNNLIEIHKVLSFETLTGRSNILGLLLAPYSKVVENHNKIMLGLHLNSIITHECKRERDTNREREGISCLCTCVTVKEKELCVSELIKDK